MPQVLLVDDEEPLRLSLGYHLAREGFTVKTAADGPEALAGAASADVIILDVMLPGMDGMEVCRRIRQASDVPIVMLTARDDSGDKVAGLDGGADDYVTKPFNARELIARLHAVLRRRAAAERLLAEDRLLVQRVEDLLRRRSLQPGAPEGTDASATGVVSVGPITVDSDARVIRVRGELVATTAPEFDLLRLLVTRRGRVVTRTELIEQIWGTSNRDTLTLLDVHIRTLREKIEENPAQPAWIVTVPGIGFQLA